MLDRLRIALIKLLANGDGIVLNVKLNALSIDLSGKNPKKAIYVMDCHMGALHE